MITPPLALVRSDEQETETYLHVGRGLCGHDGIIHGGLLATILDEAMGRVVRGLYSSPRAFCRIRALTHTRLS